MATILIRLELTEGTSAQRVLDVATLLLGDGVLRDDLNADFGDDAITVATAEIDNHEHCTCSCHEPCDDDCEGC